LYQYPIEQKCYPVGSQLIQTEKGRKFHAHRA